MKLRPYQSDLSVAIDAEWSAGHRVVCAVSPTGSGKTVLFSYKAKEHRAPCCLVAHRQELVEQISLALAKWGVRHRVIAQKQTVRMISHEHLLQLGQSFVDPSAPVAVASIDTLRTRKDLGQWTLTVTLWIMDECHHVLRKNKWGNVVDIFPNARGLGVTATPCRADGKGLSSETDGLMDALVVGPTMRDLIKMGNLCDYKIFAPPNDIDLESVKISESTGDYSKTQLSRAVQASHIVGDVVEHYLRLASGKRGVTFSVDVKTATEIARRYNEAGVPAAVISAKTPDQIRKHLIKQFAAGELLNLVNVDLFGEGFDLPAIEVVSFARPTQSYALYVQQFGRALRPLEGKSHAIIIDHVGNVVRHGLPDAAREWSLDRKAKRARKKGDDEIPLTSCVSCLGVYLRIHKVCPYCGHTMPPQERSAPEHVDGDLIELDPAVLAKMRGEADRLVGPAMVPQHLNAVAQAGCRKQHEKRREAQLDLRASLELWLGYRRAANFTVSEAYRTFYFKFGIDMLSAQKLGRTEARALTDRVQRDIGELHVAYSMG